MSATSFANLLSSSVALGFRAKSAEAVLPVLTGERAADALGGQNHEILVTRGQLLDQLRNLGQMTFVEQPVG